MNKKKLLLIALPAAAVIVALVVVLVLRYTSPDRFVIPDHIVICLDAGHGGEDPGAVFEGRQEKNDNLNMVLAVRDALEREGHENLTVILTNK